MKLRTSVKIASAACEVATSLIQTVKVIDLFADLHHPISKH